MAAAGGGGGDDLGALLTAAVSSEENAVDDEIDAGAHGGSSDEAAAPVSIVGIDAMTDAEAALEESEAVVVVEAPPPPPVPNPVTIGRGSGRGNSRGAQAVAAAQQAVAAAAAAPAPVQRRRKIAEKHQAEWGALNQQLHWEPQAFVGSPGPTHWGEEPLTRGDKHRLTSDSETAYFYFRKFWDEETLEHVVRETNIYVTSMHMRPRPPGLRKHLLWPPKWMNNWEPVTKDVIMWFMGCLLWVGMHKTQNEEELWSTQWLFERPAATCFFTFREFKTLKAALHVQNDDEGVSVTDMDGKPMLRKIGFLMDAIRHKCQLLYRPGPDIALDEVSIQMSGRSQLKKKLRHKPIGEGIQFFALAESKEGSQYLYTFELDRNDAAAEPDKVQRSVLRLVGKLPSGSRNYRIAADNLFNSVDTCRKVAALGHRIYGTLRADRGAPDHLKAVMGQLKSQGDWCFVMSPRDNLVMAAWHDSGVCMALSNIHPNFGVQVLRRTKGRADRISINAPLVFAEYNRWMGAIDDVDRLMSFYTTRLRSHKWWHAVFTFLIDVSALNALHLWRCANPEAAEKMERRRWMAWLIEEIIQHHGDRFTNPWGKAPRVSRADPDHEFRPYSGSGGRGGSHEGTSDARKVVQSASEGRLTERHFMERTQFKRNCALCYLCLPDKGSEKLIVWRCIECNVYLHNPECFNEWHTKEKPRSPFV